MAESSETIKAEEEDDLSDVPTKDVPQGITTSTPQQQQQQQQQPESTAPEVTPEDADSTDAPPMRTGSAVMYIDFSTGESLGTISV